MEHQLEISKKRLSTRVGLELDILIDEVTRKHFIGRTKFDAPDIDGLVYIKNNGKHKVNAGDMVRAEVIDSDEYDLFAKIVGDNL